MSVYCYESVALYGKCATGSVLQYGHPLIRSLHCMQRCVPHAVTTKSWFDVSHMWPLWLCTQVHAFAHSLMHTDTHSSYLPHNAYIQVGTGCIDWFCTNAASDDCSTVAGIRMICVILMMAGLKSKINAVSNEWFQNSCQQWCMATCFMARYIIHDSNLNTSWTYITLHLTVPCSSSMLI